MTFDEIKERLAEINPEALLADGFEDALVGIASQFTRTLALYDRRKCIDPDEARRHGRGRSRGVLRVQHRGRLDGRKHTSVRGVLVTPLVGRATMTP